MRKYTFNDVYLIKLPGKVKIFTILESRRLADHSIVKTAQTSDVTISGAEHRIGRCRNKNQIVRRFFQHLIRNDFHLKFFTFLRSMRWKTHFKRSSICY